MVVKGQIISGSFGEILVRQKHDDQIELGELLIAEKEENKFLLQSFDLSFGSQISQQNLELISGMNLEQNEMAEFLEPELRNYSLAKLKSLLSIKGKIAKSCKEMPDFFGTVREVKKEDFNFIDIPSSPLTFGNLRSGSRVVDVPIELDAEEVTSHHVLIPATTGKGKSNLMKYLLWNLVETTKVGVLVLDPHDEYYGRTKKGLKDHSKRENVVYYTSDDVPAGCFTLKIDIGDLKPSHFEGVSDFSSAQLDAISMHYAKYKDQWILELMKGSEIGNRQVFENTIYVLQRKMSQLLGIEYIEDEEYDTAGEGDSDGTEKNGHLVERSIFSMQTGSATLKNILNDITKGKVVIIDSSSFAGSSELLLSSIITNYIFNAYKVFKKKGTLNEKPVVGVVLEEAPRVIGKEVLEKGHNVFSTIAREGRKFRVGLYAITQLPSLIPRQILANMNTKIILGIEMSAERQAIIDSAAQDLSQDGRAIASLDKGEAIISSNFARFAIPVTIPLFEDVVEKETKSRVRLKF